MRNEPPKQYGNYRGEVIRTDDPLKAGRIKVNVFGVYDDIPEDSIPWAIYADPAMGGFNNVGSAVIPEVGAHVWCFFEGGDHHMPVYWAGAPAMKDGVPDIPSESANGYPANKVRRTKSGILMEMDDSDGNIRLLFQHPTGTQLLMNDTGDQVENVSNNRQTNVTGSDTLTTGGSKTETIGGPLNTTATEVTINSDGNVTITAGGNVNVTGALINLN